MYVEEGSDSASNSQMLLLKSSNMYVYVYIYILQYISLYVITVTKYY